MRRTTLFAILTVLLLLGASCTDGDDVDEATTTSETTTTTEVTTTTQTAPPSDDGDLSLTKSCTNAEAGYSLDYPEEWFANDGEVVAECRLFDVQEIQVELATEPDVPITADVEPVEFERVAQASRGEEVVDRRELAPPRSPGVRLVTRATEDAPLRQPGELTTRYVIDLGEGQTFIATARATETVDHDRAQQVLDAMIDTLVLPGGDSG